jgi:hypothetical protein
MSRIRANKITNKLGTGAVELEKGAHLPIGMGITGAGGLNITGVVSATSFSGNGSGLIGVASTDNIVTGTAATFNTYPVDINAGMTVAGVSTFGAITATSFGAVSGTTGTFSGSVSIGGTLTYEDVTNIDSVGIVTAREGVFIPDNKELKIGNTAGSPDLKIYHDTSDSIIQGSVPTVLRSNLLLLKNFDNSKSFIRCTNDNNVEIYYNNSKKLNTEAGGVLISGVCSATSYTGDGSNLTGISVGITTEALTTAGNTVTLDLSKDDHKITKSGTYTITCTGGSEASAHTLRIVNSGIATVGFSTYFLFPSGGVPSLPTTNGAISLISFTVHRAGAVGVSTQLISGASLNFS